MNITDPECFLVDPQKRKESPDFYGYIPDGGSRAVIFGCMVLNSSLLLLLRGLSVAMLMTANMRYLLVYMAGDMALYLLQKVARGDFYYWTPLDGAVGLFTSLVARVIGKTISDFTGIVHWRSPQELGGLYWTLNMFLALLASVVSCWISDSSENVWKLIVALGGSWAATFALFFLLMKKEYRGTFVSTMTAKSATMEKFEADDEAVKASILKKNKHHWVAIRGEVKEWIRNNYWRWEEEKPAFFTDAFVAKVPPDMIPNEARASARLIRVSVRRNSIFGGAGGKEAEGRGVQPVI